MFGSGLGAIVLETGVATGGSWRSDQRTIPGSENDSLKHLQHSRHLQSTARSLQELAEGLLAIADTPIAGSVPLDASYVRRLITVRQTRARFFDSKLFADPVWDLLLDLTAATLEQHWVSVSSACIAAAVPTSSALRCIRTMQLAGLVERRADPDDGRRSYVALTDTTFAAMIGYLTATRNAFAGPQPLR